MKLITKKTLLTVIFVAVFFLSSLQSHASSLKVCYDARYFFKIAETCIEYELKENGLFFIASSGKTVPPVSALKSVTQQGYSFMDRKTMTSKSTLLNETGAKYATIQEYEFKDGKAFFSITKRKDGKGIYSKKKGEVEGENFLDAYASTIAMQMDKDGNGEVKVFHEGKIIYIPYKKIKTERIKLDSGVFHTRVIELSPRAKVSGKFQPKGTWRFWIDRVNGLLVKMEVEFSIGKVKLVSKSIEGDRLIFARAFNY